ncbi:hypothetical protein L228DRAFT_245147 [Xylona heveae TC161]|uniref:F-box domain-containing protein n=1 Tax=Xylona heveae (strain CBS 132557 / TC161) TaxID=1328760 RepID=A0A165I1X7_XYLHT|nr:hypothetical protein L228DRAFT_245147 [Xylona heveae TC161]KZF24243.1 hypothetical protein L228DRAFT_245147 [Xylona heveae TC161]
MIVSIDKLSESTYIYQNLPDHTLDKISTLCPLDNGRHHTSASSSKANTNTLGTLDQLPLELLHMTLAQLEIQSLTDFRRVNRRAMLIVDSIPEYAQIIAHVPISIRAILSIGSGSWISCQDLYQKLCTAECDICGDFGGYLYLITCRRVCYLCFAWERDYLPLLRTDVLRKFGLRNEHLAGLPSMRSLPGVYSPREIKSRARITLIDHSTARQAGIALHGTESAMEQYASNMASKRLEKYQSRKSLHELAGRVAGPTPRRPRSEDAFDGVDSNPKRFMAIICAPFLDRRRHGPSTCIEWGFQCLACKPLHYHKPFHWRRKFTEESFQTHLRECGEIMDGKHKQGVN